MNEPKRLANVCRPCAATAQNSQYTQPCRPLASRLNHFSPAFCPHHGADIDQDNLNGNGECSDNMPESGSLYRCPNSAAGQLNNFTGCRLHNKQFPKYPHRNEYYNYNQAKYTNEQCNLYCKNLCASVEGCSGIQRTDEEESVIPGLLDKEFLLLHRSIPGLRRQGIDTNSFRQYFYPDGGWGWIICGTAFLAYLLSTGLQMSYSILFYYVVQHFKKSSNLEFLGILSWCLSTIVAPVLVTVGRKKSNRLMAVIGGMLLPLGVLFTSFAIETSQMIFSYGFVVAIGAGMVREASSVILGTYFKQRRYFVEMIVMSGEGIGIALFSVVIREGVGKAGWRAGLQMVSALMALCFFMAVLYRPASLYHPHRRAIEHLKNQHKKMKNIRTDCKMKVKKKSHACAFDLSICQSTTTKILLMISSVSAVGIYAPMFLLTLHAMKEGSEIQELVLLQAFLGMSSSCGVLIAGLLKSQSIRIGRFFLTTKILSQFLIALVALAILLLSFNMGYRGLCILSWLYGIGFGGFRYSLKSLTLERVKLKEFTTIWGLMKSTESIPIIVSVPLTSFLNDYSLKYGRAGYYICAAAAAITGIIIFFLRDGHESHWLSRSHEPRPVKEQPLPSVATHLQLHKKPHSDFPGQAYPLRSCASLNELDPHPLVPECNGHSLNTRCHVCLMLQRPQLDYDKCFNGPLQRSFSYVHPKCVCEECDLEPQEMPCKTICQRSCGRREMCGCEIPAPAGYNFRSLSYPDGLCYISDNYHASRRLQHQGSNLPLRRHKSILFQQQHEDYRPQRCPRHRQRAQSLSRPLQYIEQITTSV